VSSLERLGWNSFFEQQVRDGDERVPSALQWSRVVEEQRGACRVAGEYEGCVEISGRVRHQARSPADFPAVGDWVGVRDAIVHRRLERRSTIARAAAGAAIEQQVMAANVDTIFLVTAATRDLNPRRLERYLTTVWDAGAVPVVVLNKADLTEDPERACDDLRSRLPLVDVVAVSALGLAARATVEDALSPYLRRAETIALLGSSGVGKSTIVNRLIGHDVRKVGAIRESDGRGRHTTTARHLVELPSGALLIDTPGMRELVPWTQSGSVDGAFDDIARSRATAASPTAGTKRNRDARCSRRQTAAVSIAIASSITAVCCARRHSKNASATRRRPRTRSADGGRRSSRSKPSIAIATGRRMCPVRWLLVFVCSASLLGERSQSARRGRSAESLALHVYRVQLDTTKGQIVIEVNREWAPQGADRFYELVASGYYDDNRFFRVVAGRWAQFGINGDPAVAKQWRGKAIPDDPRKESNVRGTVAFAFAVPNGRTTQVYIALNDLSSTQDAQGFAPFGRVVSGMEVADALNSEYGENSGGGIRAGKQQPLFDGGNAYLDREFPRLDRIVRARVIP